MIAYGQNGEAIRPAQGYPARLLLPGWEGNAQVKWIRRVEVSDRPSMTRDETSKYTDPLADGTARQFSFVMDAKSIITFPAFPNVLPERGWWEITGLAWSGRGRITRVEVSTDGGGSWAPAQLQEPVLSKCTTRFRHIWNWDGGEALLMSRAIDETGYVQPDLETQIAARGAGSSYHYNTIRPWRVEADGRVFFAQGEAHESAEVPAPERATLGLLACHGARVVVDAGRTPRTETAVRRCRARPNGRVPLPSAMTPRQPRSRPWTSTSDRTEPALLRGAAPSPRANRSTTPNARDATAPPGKRVPTIDSWVVSPVTDFRSAKPEASARRSGITGRTPRPYSTT